MAIGTRADSIIVGRLRPFDPSVTARNRVACCHTGSVALLSADQLLAFLEAQGTEWVRRARLQYRPLGRPLTAPERVAIEPFFEAALLYSVRITNVPGIANPGFYSFLLEQSIAIPLD